MERYFIGTLHQACEIEQLIKTDKTKGKVFQVVIRESVHIKRFTWFLLKNDLAFERKPLGSGITNFFVDLSMPFFTKRKK